MKMYGKLQQNKVFPGPIDLLALFIQRIISYSTLLIRPCVNADFRSTGLKTANPHWPSPGLHFYTTQILQRLLVQRSRPLCQNDCHYTAEFQPAFILIFLACPWARTHFNSGTISQSSLGADTTQNDSLRMVQADLPDYSFNNTFQLAASFLLAGVWARNHFNSVTKSPLSQPLSVQTSQEQSQTGQSKPKQHIQQGFLNIQIFWTNPY